MLQFLIDMFLPNGGVVVSTVIIISYSFPIISLGFFSFTNVL